MYRNLLEVFADAMWCISRFRYILRCVFANARLFAIISHIGGGKILYDNPHELENIYLQWCRNSMENAIEKFLNV